MYLFGSKDGSILEPDPVKADVTWGGTEKPIPILGGGREKG
jgi:hypothetical protein